MEVIEQRAEAFREGLLNEEAATVGDWRELEDNHMTGGKEQGLQNQEALGSDPAWDSLVAQFWVTHFSPLSLH